MPLCHPCSEIIKTPTFGEEPCALKNKCLRAMKEETAVCLCVLALCSPIFIAKFPIEFKILELVAFGLVIHCSFHYFRSVVMN